MIGFLAFAFPLALYYGLPSCMWNFDGVACAAALELGNPVFFFHANHLLYGFFGFIFWRGLMHPLGITRALPALQIFTPLLSAAGLTGLYNVLKRLSTKPWLALAVTWTLAVTAVFWVWTVEPQVYALGFLGLAWATYVLFSSKTAFRMEKLGLWHALAVLGHVVNFLWVVPAIYWLYQETIANPPHRAAMLGRYLGWLVAGVMVPYVLVFALFILPARPGTEWAWTWLKGSAGLAADHRWQWHSPGLRGPLEWAVTSLKFFWGSFWSYPGHVASSLVWPLTALSAAGFCFAFGSSWRTADKVRRNFSLLWLGIFAVFFWTWEPATECYRLAEIIPVAMLIMLGLQRLNKEHYAFGVAGIVLISTLTVNLLSRIYPMSRASNNSLYEQTVSLSKLTPSNSLYLTEGGSPWMYILYFTGRAAWNIQSFNPNYLGREILRHKTLVPVFVHTAALRDEAAQAWLASHHLAPVADGLPWLRLQ